MRVNEAQTTSRNDAGYKYLDHSDAQRINTNVQMMTTLRRQYPELQVTAVSTLNCPLLGYAQAGHATFKDVSERIPLMGSISTRLWIPPARRIDHEPGLLAEELIYGKYEYTWKDKTFILYVIDGRDGDAAYPIVIMQYIIGPDSHAADALISECSRWATELHDEIWVFDGGRWTKSSELWRSIQKSEWDDVILDEDEKTAIRHDIEHFYASRDSYQKLKVPWKRGLIFHGPPGNGKTISIKATMHELLRVKEPIPTLYVRTLRGSFLPPEIAISIIFSLARREAPCFLVFEDLDSIVTDDVRSYFLNEVDGLRPNDGILMVGSTNHLDRLDPGLSKRPSRFDRKYYFPDPSLKERIAYAKFWQKKLAQSPEVEFPDALCPAVARITDGFSFAYIQEAFIASLLELARRPDGHSRVTAGPRTSATVRKSDVSLPVSFRASLESAMTGISALGTFEDDDSDLDGLPLWEELQKQVAILREGMDDTQVDKVDISATHRPLVVPSRSMQAVPLGGPSSAASHHGEASIGPTHIPDGMLDEMRRHAARTGAMPVLLDR